MTNRDGARVEWWVMDSFPDQNWARLTVFSDGHGDVLDCDGRTTHFSSEEDAVLWLLEDEFLRYSTLTEEDVAPLRLDAVKPPTGTTDEDLLPQMLVRWSG